jgi:DNA (cytosine-5)-methyltransferase 1
MKTVDLFAGCGGLSIGFDKVGFQTLGYLDWDNHCIETLKTNFKKNSAVFMHGDIRDIANGKNKNIDNFLAELKSNSVDGIIGGPPCQAYSIAGRVRDPNGMKNDYRNYLFESYAIFLKELKPLFFVFENVTGLLSAKPDGLPIVKNISRSFRELGYEIPNIDKNIVIDLANLGGAQKRKRVILFGVDSKRVKNAPQIIQQFYINLKNQYEEPKTVQDAIGNLPKLYPLDKPTKRKSHAADEKDLLHTSRFHNARDIKIFNILADDIKTKSFKYKSVESIKKLYEEHVGKKSKVHKYFVLKWDEPSNLIPAHLYKDGLRHIHPDPQQSRSISLREAARLQNFPDKYIFMSPQTETFKMLGNAVSPLMAEKIANAVKMTLSKII